MFFFKASLTSTAAFFAYAQATYLNNDLSFGHDGKISPNGRAIPNFHMIGQPNYPDILSNRIVLTPPAPGNQRGAVWTEKTLQHSQWAADIEFRATGPERAGGNLNIWYAKNEDVKLSSIYTVGKFDGLALVVDQHAGSAGYIRGFLNDGKTEYSSHHSVDSLAFGHCPYSYRNRGIPSKIHIRQTTDNFKVEVDGALCFQSNKIKLPLGYVFGVTAASAENPDSFEIFKFVVTTDSHAPDDQVQNHAGQNQQQFQAANNPPPNQQQNHQQNQGQDQKLDIPGETPASDYKSSDAQFADLHNRLQAMMKHITALNRDLSQYQANSLSRTDTLNGNINSLTKTISHLESSLSKLESIPALERNLRDVANDVKSTKKELHEALDRHVLSLKQRVAESHGSVLGTVGEGLKSNKSGVGYAGLAFVVVGSQVGLVVAYVLYKKRKNGGSKKFL
ncbi:hypothetical protein EYC80_010102 [Monilinia laxa]|uniref:L-type lectin-like domain-containing protein n=1 Tax=Monilinia laxa TaxID=61186 RepID=A0A5N6JQP7_MONLA|nr:hypothetical protein EYC80_010448 [Monilinia laxa]KAB8291429.1 hypothetical protein EYC80_010102 [Monilinia laxa]